MNRLILIFVVLLLVSCKTKLKIVEREKVITSINILEATNEIKKTDIVIDSVAKTEVSILTITKNDVIELTQADSDKVITIEDETGKKLTIKGANVIIKTASKIEEKNQTESINLSKIDKSETVKSTKKDTQSSSKKTSRNTDTKITGTSTWLWIGLIIALLLVAAYFVLKYRPGFL